MGIRRRIRVQAVGLRMGSRCMSGNGRLLVESLLDTDVDVGAHHNDDYVLRGITAPFDNR